MLRSRSLPRLAVPLLLIGGCAAPVQEHAPTPEAASDTSRLEVLREAAVPLTGAPGDYDALMQRIGDARVVLLGEATHGTHEFYRERARITQRLIRDKGFTAVLIEGDWPDAWRVNRYVRGLEGTSGRGALAGFERFPTWMWRNAEVLEFVEWLRAHNAGLPATAPRAGFYGLDIYSFAPAMEAVTAYLGRTDPEAARRARQRYACFRRFGDDAIAYGQAVESRSARSCQREVAEQLREMERIAALPANASGNARDESFAALGSARSVSGAEEYFRSSFLPGISTWNLRDRFMMETLERLMRHLEAAQGQPARVVVWAHNSHVGDARATHMGEQGELNIGQLARQRFGGDAVLVGFTTHTGTVMAASDWGGEPERKQVRPSLPESYERLFHETGIPSFLLLTNNPRVREALYTPRLERAIGVIYLPQSERVSHYFHARLPDQFDAVIHWDVSRAVQPLTGRGASAGGSAYLPPTAGRTAPPFSGGSRGIRRSP